MGKLSIQSLVQGHRSGSDGESQEFNLSDQTSEPSLMIEHENTNPTIQGGAYISFQWFIWKMIQ